MISINDFNKGILTLNGHKGQLPIIQGELAELITEISDTFFRDDYREKSNYKDVEEEMADVILQLEQLFLIISRFKNISVDDLIDKVYSMKEDKKEKSFYAIKEAKKNELSKS